MYCLVAIPFRSYLQSFVVLFAIPFGFVGALVGHIIMGFNLSIVSMFGLVALSGVVINDSLVLVHTANRMVDSGMSLMEAVQKAGIRRFRPIILTSVTTAIALLSLTLVPQTMIVGFGLTAAIGTAMAYLATLSALPALARLLLGWQHGKANVGPDRLFRAASHLCERLGQIGRAHV